MIKTQKISYDHRGCELEAYYAFDDQHNHQLPVVLVAHDWTGRNAFACQKAESLAELGYVGFAIDMYGKNKLGKTKEEKTNLMQPLMQDRSLLQERMQAGLKAAHSLEMVDSKRSAAIGFCFGGLCALDLARSGAAVKGVVSFHGLLTAPNTPNVNSLTAKLLVLHGYNDPMVPPEQVIQFSSEMTRYEADWQIIMYSNTVHGFTNPEANDPDFGTVYHPLTAKRAWLAMKNFLNEILQE